MQIAGLVARRILCYVKAGDRLARGERYGFIRFGSRVDVYLPPGLAAARGDRRQGEGHLHGARGSRGVGPRAIDGAMAMPVERPAKPALERVRKRGIYLLPNLFTTLALFAGFYAIVQGMNHNFEQAAVAVFVAMVLDGLDGRVARLTRTQSAFGAEYDSLADMVSFGAAPALLMYEWALRGMGRIGWIAAFVYCAGAALRLARFNTQLAVADKRWFTGIPSPAAAALVAGMIWVFNDYQVAGAATCAGSPRRSRSTPGVTMVTNVKFYSGKDINLRRQMPFWVTIVIVVALLLISIEPSHVLWGMALLYGISGYVRWAVQRARAEATQKQYQRHPRGDRGRQHHGARAHALGHARGHRGRAGRKDAAHGGGGGGEPSGDRAARRARRAARPARRPGRHRARARRRDGIPGGGRGAARAEGADPNAHDLSGMTPLDMAEEHGAHDIAALLLRYGGKSSKELAPQEP